MNQKKVPFKSYTIMNNSLINHFNCSDVYRLFVLSLTTDRELKTDTTLDQLADFVGEKATAYKGNNKSKSFTDKLRECNEIDVKTEDGISFKNGNRVTRNIYTFKEPVPTMYRRISKTLIDLDISIKLKGYIIKLFSVSESHSYTISKSINELEKLLKMGKTTIKKYNEELISLGLLQTTDNGWLLNVEALIIDNPKKIPTEAQKIFDSIELQIQSFKSLGLSLTKEQAIYLNAKKSGFKSITDLKSWSLWLVTGVPYKAQTDNDFEITI